MLRSTFASRKSEASRENVRYAALPRQSGTNGRTSRETTLTRTITSVCVDHATALMMALSATSNVQKVVMPHDSQADRWFAICGHLTGGIELGLERTGGFETRWQVESDPYSQKVLAKHWPDCGRWDDVRTFPPRSYEFHYSWRGLAAGPFGPDLKRDTSADAWRVDLICGGFPCQDVSIAGRRSGITGERSGLWFEYARIIRMLRPRFALVENTPGLLDRGMGDVLRTLAEIGYDAEWSTVSACSMGAPFPRERVFVVAFPACERQGQLRGIERAFQGEEKRDVCWQGLESRVPRTANGVPNKLDRLTTLGNAVVPQVATWVGERILEAIAREDESG